MVRIANLSLNGGSILYFLAKIYLNYILQKSL